MAAALQSRFSPCWASYGVGSPLVSEGSYLLESETGAVENSAIRVFSRHTSEQSHSPRKRVTAQFSGCLRPHLGATIQDKIARDADCHFPRHIRQVCRDSEASHSRRVARQIFPDRQKRRMLAAKPCEPAAVLFPCTRATADDTVGERSRESAGIGPPLEKVVDRVDQRIEPHQVGTSRVARRGSLLCVAAERVHSLRSISPLRPPNTSPSSGHTCGPSTNSRSAPCCWSSKSSPSSKCHSLRSEFTFR
jgi:hypothetical protein